VTSGKSNVAAVALSAYISRMFVAAGAAHAESQLVSDALVDAELEGLQSHGVMLVELYVDRLRHGSVATIWAATIVSDRGVAIVMDAGHEFGHLSAARAMGLAIERARLRGAGIVAVRSAFHFGAARRFALLAVEADCIGIAMCNTRPLMPAPGGAEPVVGNNPIAIAVSGRRPNPYRS